MSANPYRIAAQTLSEALSETEYSGRTCDLGEARTFDTEALAMNAGEEFCYKTKGFLRACVSTFPLDNRWGVEIVKEGESLLYLRR